MTQEEEVKTAVLTECERLCPKPWVAKSADGVVSLWRTSDRYQIAPAKGYSTNVILEFSGKMDASCVEWQIAFRLLRLQESIDTDVVKEALRPHITKEQHSTWLDVLTDAVINAINKAT